MNTVSQDECLRRFESERRHVSHDLFSNAFGCLLLPGFNDERLTDRDVILRALRGDTTCQTDALEPALAAWRISLCPALMSLIDNVTTRYGFVVSPDWETAIRTVREAASRLDSFDERAIRDGQEALDATRSFWADCDAVRSFLASMHKSLYLYFLRWDPAAITRPDHA